MGIRIHKILGYAIIDLVENDERLNIPTKELCYLEETKTNEGFIEFLNVCYYHSDVFWVETCFYYTKKNKVPNIIFNEEFGLPNVLLFIPPGFNNWYRYDDTIDFYQDENQENKFREISGGIYPFNYIYYDTEKRERLDGVNSHFYAIMSNNPEFYENVVFEKYKNVIPYVPEDVQYYCQYLNIFKSFDTIMRLKPILYTYWG